MALYFFSRLAGAFKRRLGEAARAPAPAKDPIDHPDIAAMSLAELADLPLGPDRDIPPDGFEHRRLGKGFVVLRGAGCSEAGDERNAARRAGRSRTRGAS
jgi:hypothetical protein